jgi:hypothetical protein
VLRVQERRGLPLQGAAQAEEEDSHRKLPNILVTINIMHYFGAIPANPR